ncbi:MAG: hypothetical protein H6651_10065 [Ardenticatenales bacterium]|nr:hypothetical protein [Ardenticatenales bacterium]
MKNPAKTTFWLLVCLSGLWSLAACTQPAPPEPTATVPAIASPSSEPTATPTVAAADTESVVAVDEWLADLAYFRERIDQLHPNPYYRVPAATYDAKLAALAADLPNLSETEIIVRLTEIMAFVDGHSSIHLLDDPVNFQLYPLQFYSFADGVFLINAQAPFEEYIGGQLLRVGNRPVAAALAALQPYIPHDNPMTIRQSEPFWLIRPEFLQTLGIIGDADAPAFLIKLADGSQHTLNPSPISSETYSAWLDGPATGLPLRPGTLYLQNRDQRNWSTYLADSQTLYIQYNQVLGSTSRLIDDINQVLANETVERVVLDIRLNGGGNNNRYGDLLALVSSHPQINRPGHFFTIIGRQTFSAATNLATELENQTETIFVGEPTGGSPNLYGDTVVSRLPNAGIAFAVSNRYWQFSTPDDTRVWLPPDIPVELSSTDFFNDHDPALATILAYTPSP